MGDVDRLPRGQRPWAARTAAIRPGEPPAGRWNPGFRRG